MSTVLHHNVIVAAVDGGRTTDDVIDATIAAAHGYPCSEIHFVHIAEPLVVGVGEMPVRGTAELEAEGRKILAGVVARTTGRFSGPVETHLATTLAAAGILELAALLHASLIVVGTNGKQFLDRIALGSVSREVVHHARCAVLVARTPGYAKAEPAPIKEAS